MKKSLFIISLMTIFACNRENENLENPNSLSESSKTISHRSGDIGGMPLYFIPNNIQCGNEELLLPLENLPYGAPSGKKNITVQYNPLVASIHEISLPELIISYLDNQGITVEEVLFDNNTPPTGSYFENNYFKEYTFSEEKSILDEDGNPNPMDFGVFNFNDYMNKDDASWVVKNVYNKIISSTITNNTIKGIRIFYNDSSCPDITADRRNLKIQVIYGLNYATQEPVIEL